MTVIEGRTDPSVQEEEGGSAGAFRPRLLPRAGLRYSLLLFLVLLLVGLVPLVLQALWSAGMLAHEAEAEEEAAQTALAQRVAARLEKFAAMAGAVLHAGDAALRGGAEAELLGPLLTGAGLRFVALVGPDGSLVACLPAPGTACPTALPGAPALADLAERAFRPGGPVFTLLLDPPGTEPLLLLVRPPLQQGVGAAATLAAMMLDPFAAIAEAGGRAEARTVTLHDGDGRLLYSEGPAPAAPAGGEAAAGLPVAGRTEILDPVDGRLHPASRVTVPELGWTVTVHRRDGGLAALVPQLWTVAGILALAVLAAAAVLALLLSRSMSRAVRLLVDASNAVRALSRRRQEDPEDDRTPPPEALAARAAQHPSREVRQLAASMAAMAAAVRARQERDAEEVRAAQASNEKKSAFVANISHQLRTPLNSIIGFSEMMTDQLFGPLGNAKYLEYAHSVHDSGEYLMRILNDVRDLSRAEIGVLDLEETTLDVGRLLRASISIVSREAHSRDVRLDLVQCEDMPVIRGDEQRLQQALINLITHAVSATPDGAGVEIATTLQDNGDLRVRIRHGGRPIADSDLAKLLTPFDEVQRSYDRRFEGAGLGLPLARTLLELHGGRLDIERLEEGGNALTATLPASRVLRQTAA